MNTTTYTQPRPKTSRHNNEWTFFGTEYHMMLTNHYGDVRKYMVRKNRHNPRWGWDVYVISLEDEYKWELIIDQMSTRDTAIKSAVGHSMSHGITTVFGHDIEWA